MLGKTHLALSLFLGLLLFQFVKSPFIFLGIVLLSSLVADIDIKTSKLGKCFLFRPIQFFVKHRGIFHSLLFMILVIILFLFFYPIGALAFFIGYFSHLILDGLSVEGVRLFYPFGKKFSGIFRVGGFFEKILFFVLVVLDFFMVVFIILKLNFF